MDHEKGNRRIKGEHQADGAGLLRRQSMTGLIRPLTGEGELVDAQAPLAAGASRSGVPGDGGDPSNRPTSTKAT